MIIRSPHKINVRWVNAIGLSFTLILFLLGCNKTVEPDFSEFGYEYYPIEIGQYRVYHTQVINYNLDESIDTTLYLMKEVVEDTVTYTNGDQRYILGRHSAPIGSTVWHKDSLWAVQVTSSNVIVSEANVDFVKLAFPVKENLQWDGNVANSGESETYEMVDLNKSYAFDTLNFASTLTVIQADLLDPVKITKDDYRKEVFASDIGLVHKLKIGINYCSTCEENGTIEDGVIFEQKLIEFGKE